LKKITILDTDITSSNLGNEIIMQGVFDFLHSSFQNDYLMRLECTDQIGPMSKKYILSSDLSFIGGSNLLTSQINQYKQIGFSFLDSFKIQNMILIGVGWWQYQNEPNLISRNFLRNLLSNRITHSVRDEYTKEKLTKIGITNVLNTSCPSTWNLTETHCNEIPKIKSDKAVFTLTDYNHESKFDSRFINMLIKKYEKVYFWPQGWNDMEYIKSLNIEDLESIKIVPPYLKSFDDLLENNDIDYVGTRLHAGIRAIQKKRRALVLSIDNRASEISNDIGMNVVPREDIEKIEFFITNEQKTSIKIPHKNIDAWKAQFIDF
jgi:polysaccharide pyruvyl transferase WcaK-like protein